MTVAKASLMAAAVVCGLAPRAFAQSGDFFAGKTVDLHIGYDAGSSYDKYGRLLADHISRFIPGNPSFVSRNMPGAGSMRAANFIIQAAKKDGTAWALVDRNVTTEPLLYGGESKAAFKHPRELTWIGSLNTEIGVFAVWQTVGVSTWEEAQKKPIIAAMASSQGGVSAKAINALLGGNLQQVCCYGGDNNQNLALERGEVEARVGWSWSSLKITSMEWLQSGKIKLLMQIGLQKNPEIPADVPLILDLATNEKDKAALRIIFSSQSVGRPFIMPVGVPKDRVEIVQRAFTAMAKDKDFLAQADRHRLEVNDPKSGDEIAHLLTDVYAAVPEVVAAARAAIKSGEVKMIEEKK